MRKAKKKKSVPPYFSYKDLLNPPIMRAAYSDRTAWLMAEMSRVAYIPFEQKPQVLDEALKKGGFQVVKLFNAAGTQAFLARRTTGNMAILAFRGTEQRSLKDIQTDLDIRFYRDKSGARIHNGFFRAFEAVADEVRQGVGALGDHALYVTGHSLGGALALIATRALNSDNLAACYTFGCPRVGNEEFGETIKPPIYRVINAYDIVPFLPPAWIFEVLGILVPFKWLRRRVRNFSGYDHQGDLRYLTPCADPKDVKVLTHYNEWSHLFALWRHRHEAIAHHSIDTYIQKLARYAIKRRNMA